MGSRLRLLMPGLFAALLALGGAAGAHAQDPTASLGAFAARLGLGVEAAGGLGPVAVYGRAEGFDTWIVSAGLRAHMRMRGGSIYASGLIGRGRCPRAGLSGAVTGCDGERHALVGAALGLELDVGPRFSMFLDGGKLSTLDSSSDIPSWTFAAGLRFHPVARSSLTR